MATKDLQTIPELAADWTRRVLAHTEEVTYFGANSVMAAIAQATAEQAVLVGGAGVRALMRRQTLLGAQADALDEVLEEHGVPRLGPARASTLVILQPWATTVTAVAGALIAVSDATHFDVGASVRIVNGDGSTTEVVEVLAKHSGTGPNGEDELDVGALVGAYDPTTETVGILLRTTVPAGTILVSTAGVQFATLDDVTVGDRNPVLLGESTELALADKVWVEAVEPGAAGNVEADSIRSFQAPNDAVASITNPTAAADGSDTERDFDARYRAAHTGQIVASETQAALEALARQGNRSVLRAFAADPDAPSTVRLLVLSRSGAGLSSEARAALADYMSARLRSRTAVVVENATATAVEVAATITLTPGSAPAATRLRSVFSAAAARFAAYLDWRKWAEGEPVDEAALVGILRSTPGVRAVTTSTFTPSADVAVTYVPRFARLTLTDSTSGLTLGSVLSTTY